MDGWIIHGWMDNTWMDNTWMDGMEAHMHGWMGWRHICMDGRIDE
jgi:hypothetical protein